MTDPTTSNIQSLRTLEDLMADLATLTGLAPEQVNQQLEPLNFTVFQFQGVNLVSPDMADELVDRWAQSIKTQLRQERNNGNHKVTAMFPSAGTSRLSLSRRAKVDRKVTEPKEAPPTKTASSKTASTNGNLPDIELKVPRDVFKLVSTRYDVAIRKVLPKDPETQQAYLQHIVTESEQGHEFLMQIAIVLAKKYKGRVGKDTAYKRMLEKAQALAAG
ncbi:MAG: hypothetical protein ACO31I_01755 [Prochlorotrichaceae cyanobacterium]|jgi:hypothetical protein